MAAPIATSKAAAQARKCRSGNDAPAGIPPRAAAVRIELDREPATYVYPRE